MRTPSRRTKVRSLLAAGVVAGSILVVAPPAHATCAGHFQPGGTLTVGGNPVRIPTIDVEVCHVGPTTSIAPMPEAITGPSGACFSNCFALGLRADPTRPATDVTVRAELDGAGVDRQVLHLTHDDSFVCLVGVGFPAPPVSGCFISFDPDF
jgi:hypothetical protein